MKLVVCAKQVKVLGDEVAFTQDGREVDSDLLEYALNEWDACAAEEALKIRDELGSSEVVVITAGESQADGALRRCLAMGADRAIRVNCTALDPITTARALAAVVRLEEPDLVLCGVQSSDSVQGSTGVALAQMLRLPCVSVVTRLEWGGGGRALVHRELEGGLHEVVEVDIPAVLSVQTGINQPRYVTLRAIKQAETAEIAIVAASDVGEPAYRVRRMFVPTKGEGAKLLTGTPATIAAQIAALVKERIN